jgi:hypothetical protein
MVGLRRTRRAAASQEIRAREEEAVVGALPPEVGEAGRVEAAEAEEGTPEDLEVQASRSSVFRHPSQRTGVQ